MFEGMGSDRLDISAESERIARGWIRNIKQFLKRVREFVYQIVHLRDSVVYKMRKAGIEEPVIAMTIFNNMLENGKIRQGSYFLYGGCYSLCGVFFHYEWESGFPIKYESVKW